MAPAEATVTVLFKGEEFTGCGHDRMVGGNTYEMTEYNAEQATTHFPSLFEKDPAKIAEYFEAKQAAEAIEEADDDDETDDGDDEGQ